MISPLYLWVTRSAPFNLLTANHLRAAGHNPLCIPLLETRPLENGLDAAGCNALVFTSANGVRHHLFSPSMRAIPVFAVGDRTARLARDKGYQNVYSAAGNVSDLLKLICEELSPPARIVHLCATAPAGDLVGDLRSRGYRADRLHVYESIATPLASLRPALASLPWIDGILLHSRRASEAAAPFLADLGRWEGVAYCISEAAAEPLERLPGLRIKLAPEPCDRALRSIISPEPVIAAAPSPIVPRIVGSPAPTAMNPANDHVHGSGIVLPFPRQALRRRWDPDDPTPPSAA